MMRVGVGARCSSLSSGLRNVAAYNDLGTMVDGRRTVLREVMPRTGRAAGVMGVLGRKLLGRWSRQCASRGGFFIARERGHSFECTT